MSGCTIGLNGNCVAISGEVDMDSAPDVRAALEAASNDGIGIEVDLSGTTFMDSSGLSELVRPLRDGHVVSVHGASPLVRRMLELTGIDVVLKVDDGPED